MKNLIIACLLVVILGYAYYDYNKTKQVVTVKWKEGRTTRNVDVINTYDVSYGDTVLLEIHSLLYTNHQYFSIPQISPAVCHLANDIGHSTYYRMVKEVEHKAKKLQRVLKGTPLDSVWNSGSIEGRYTSLLETVSFTKGVVIRKKKGGKS